MDRLNGYEWNNLSLPFFKIAFYCILKNDLVG